MECFILHPERRRRKKKMKINQNFRLTFYTEKGRRHYHIFKNRNAANKREMKFDCVLI